MIVNISFVLKFLLNAVVLSLFAESILLINLSSELCGILNSSSRIEIIPVVLSSITSNIMMLSLYNIFSNSIPSSSYIFSSVLKVCLTKCCWSFSLA